MTLSDNEVLEGLHDLEMMRRPHLWPNDKFLPCKRRPSTVGDLRGSGLTFGCLIVVRQRGIAYVFLPVSLEAALRAVRGDRSLYDMDGITGDDFLLETLVSAGWIADWDWVTWSSPWQT